MPLPVAQIAGIRTHTNSVCRYSKLVLLKIAQRQLFFPFAVFKQLLRKGICDFIRDDDNFEIVFDAENGKSALQTMEQTDVVPDVMIVDINMPVMNGFDTAKALLKKYPQTA